MQLHPFPEPDSPELERFMLYGRGEIVAVLRHLCEERAFVTAYCGSDAEFAVTMVLSANADFDEVVLDMPADPAAQVRLLAAQGVVFVAFQENVKLQWDAPVAQSTVFEGRPAFRVRLPTQVLRLQRREYFRVRTPESSRPTCLVPHEQGNERYESLRVLNLSVGGLAVMSYPHHFELPYGVPIDACFLDLPGIGTVPVRIRVVHLGEVGRNGREFGCEFVDLPPPARLMLQRYVNRVELDQRRLEPAAAGREP